MDVRQIIAIAEAALVGLVAVLAIVVAFASSGGRPLSVMRQILVLVMPIVGFGAALYFSGLALNAMWAAVALVAGLGFGFLSAGGSTYVRKGDKSGVKPARWSAWVYSVGVILFAAALVYGGPDSASAALLVVLIGASMQAAQAITELVRGAKAPASAAA